MGFLRRLRGGDTPAATTSSTPVVSPFLDDAMGDAAARDWVAQLRRGEWRAFARHLVEEPDPQRRDFDVKVASTALAGQLEWIDGWLEEEPRSATVVLLRGAHEIDWAWAIRTGAWAKNVKKEAAEDFWDLLSVAKEDLLRAARLAPDDGGPWAFLTAVAMGLGFSPDEADEILAKVQERSLWHPMAYRTMVQYHAAKWHGSTERMLAFARGVSAEAPAGHPVHAVVPEAHLEAAADSGGKRTLAAGRDEIVDAADRSVNSAEQVASPWWTRARAPFAIVYHQLGEKDRLRQELEAIGPSVSSVWGSFYRDPIGEFKRARRSVGLG